VGGCGRWRRPYRCDRRGNCLCPFVYVTCETGSRRSS
jgi:hypothetical protein